MRDSSDFQGKRSQVVADVTRKVMLDAALDTFADYGFEASSLRSVAKKAGVSHALFRKHFGGKDALWQASVDHGVERYAAALRARAARRDTPTSTIKDLIRILLEVTVAHPALVRIMLLEGARGGSRSDYLSERWHRIGDEHRSMFHDAQWDGSLEPFVDADLFLFVLTAGMIPLAFPKMANSILETDISTKEERDVHIERLFRILFPR